MDTNVISISKKLLPLVFLAGIIICFAACDERKASPVGGTVIDREDPGQFNEVPAKAVRDSVYGTDVSLLASPYLLVGDWNGYETKSLLYFKNLPDSVRITSSELRLVTSDVIDTGAVSEHLSIVISALDWTGESVSFDDIPEGIRIGTVVVDRTDGDTVRFNFPVDTVQAWVDRTDSIALLLGYETEAGFIKRFYSNNAEAAAPQLRLTWSVVDTNDTTDTDSTVAITPYADIYAVRRTTNWPFDDKPDQLMVGSGIAYRSLLHFDIGNTIPPEATVIRAPLTLYIDDDYIFFDGMSIAVHVLTDRSWADPQFSGTQINWTNVAADDDFVVLEIRTAVQSWVNGTAVNHGLLIRSLYEHYGITSFVFHSLDSDNPALRPKLEVWYATPPDFSPKRIEKEAQREE